MYVRPSFDHRLVILEDLSDTFQPVFLSVSFFFFCFPLICLRLLFTRERTRNERALALALVLCAPLKRNLSFGGWVCFAIAGEEGIQEVRAPPLLAAQVPEVLEDGSRKLRRLFRYQRRRRWC